MDQRELFAGGNPIEDLLKQKRIEVLNQLECLTNSRDVTEFLFDKLEKQILVPLIDALFDFKICLTRRDWYSSDRKHITVFEVHIPLVGDSEIYNGTLRNNYTRDHAGYKEYTKNPIGRIVGNEIVFDLIEETDHSISDQIATNELLISQYIDQINPIIEEYNTESLQQLKDLFNITEQRILREELIAKSITNELIGEEAEEEIEPSEWALQIAAGAWCKPNTCHVVMIPELANEFAKILDKVRSDDYQMKIGNISTKDILKELEFREAGNYYNIFPRQ